MAIVEFYYLEDCPSHEKALALVQQALIQEGLTNLSLRVIEVKTEEEAQAYRFYGSPTIRVAGQDIAPPPDDSEPGLYCRAYRKTDGRISPLPPLELITQALQRARLDRESGKKNKH